MDDDIKTVVQDVLDALDAYDILPEDLIATLERRGYEIVPIVPPPETR